MRNKICRFYAGYVSVRMTGFSIERFLNLCCSNHLEIWNLKPDKDGSTGMILVNDFRKLRPLARKAGIRVRILERHGLPFVLYRNRRRKGLVIGFAGFFLFLYLLSLFIWNISFQGNYHITRDALLTYLEEEGVRYGMLKRTISCETLEEGIRSRFPEITWVSASVSGTRLMIKIKENEALSAIPEREDDPCDVVAGNEGIITEMIIRQGRTQVAVGDVVEKGQILVASALSILNDGGEVVRTAYVHADADVYAMTKYEYQERVPKLHTVEVKTGGSRWGAGIKVGPYQAMIIPPAFGENRWNYVSETRQLCIFEDFFLPVYVTRIRGDAVEYYDRLYTESEINKLSEQLQEKYLKKLLEKGVHIIENSVKIQENGFFYIIEGTVTAREQIGVKQPVSQMEQVPQENEETIKER